MNTPFESLVIEDRQRGTFMVNSRVYTDPLILASEKQKIFDVCWLYAGHESELGDNGDFITRRIGGRPIILVKGSDGTIRAFLNACRHRGNTLCREGSGNANGFRCFYHAWVYANTGELLTVPASEAYSEAFDRKQMGLTGVRLESYRGLMFVNFDANAMSLTDYLAGAKEYIDLFCDYAEDGLEVPPGSYEFNIRANWKLLFENSGDVYHAAPTHQRYFLEFLPDLAVDQTARVTRALNLPTLSLGNGHSVVLATGSTNPLRQSADQELNDKRRRLHARYGAERGNQVFEGVGMLTIFPNLFYVDSFKSIRTYYPADTGGMEVSEWPLMPREDSPGLRHKRLESSHSFLGPGGFATPDDFAAMEGCQRAFDAEAIEWCLIARGMKKEQPTIIDEAHIRTFYRRWLDLLGPRGETIRYASRFGYGDHDER